MHNWGRQRGWLSLREKLSICNSALVQGCVYFALKRILLSLRNCENVPFSMPEWVFQGIIRTLFEHNSSFVALWVLGLLIIRTLKVHIFWFYLFIYVFNHQVTLAPCRLSWSWKKLYGSMNSTKIPSSLFTVSLCLFHADSVYEVYTFSSHCVFCPCRHVPFKRLRCVWTRFFFFNKLSQKLHCCSRFLFLITVINPLIRRVHYQNIVFIDFLKTFSALEY